MAHHGKSWYIMVNHGKSWEIPHLETKPFESTQDVKRCLDKWRGSVPRLAGSRRLWRLIRRCQDRVPELL